MASEAAEKFNITIEEFFDLLGQLLDDLYEAGLCEENGSVMSAASLFLQEYQGESLVLTFAQAHQVWHDCHEKNFDFFLKDFNSLLGIKLNCAGYQKIAQVYLEMKERGEECVISEEDIETIFDFLIALSRHACRYVSAKRQTESSFLPDFPLQQYKQDFKL